MNSDEMHRKDTCEHIFRNGIWRTGSPVQLAPYLQWENEGRIFSVEYNGQKYYACYQFDEKGAPLPFLQEVLQHLHCTDSWSIAAWFYYPNSWIANGNSPTAPKDALDRKYDVIRAAMCSRGTYVA